MPKNNATAGDTLYLIDGHAQMFRAFFAIRQPMTSPVTGEPTNATFAFTGMLLKLYEQFKPTHAAMAIDPKGDTFRHELYPEYKGTRDAPPESFPPQIPRMLEVCELFNIPVIEVPGAEADDVMATLAARFKTDFQRVRLVSKDKDLQQCLAENITLFDIHTDTELDLAGLMEKKGVTPEQVVDLQVLTGDNVDNIPGVKGVGDKTAAKLIAEFGSVGNLIANIDQVKGKRRENIEAAAPQFDLVRQLVTLKTDLDLATTVEDVTLAPPDPQAIVEICKQLGFNRYQSDTRRVFKVDTPKPEPQKHADPPADAPAFGLFAQPSDEASDAGPVIPTPPGCTYESITTPRQLDNLVADLKTQTLICVDTETHGLGAATGLCGICLAWRENHGVYIPTHLPTGEHLSKQQVVDALQPILEDPAITKVAHNLKYDDQVLKHVGIRMQGPLRDTMIAAFLTGQPGLKMDDLALALLGRNTIPIEQLIGPRERGKKQKSMAEIPLEAITPYAAEDADVTLQLHHLLTPMLKTMGVQDLAETVEMPLVRVLSDMEDRGITVHRDTLIQQQEQLQKRIDQLRQQVLDAAGVDFNPDSPKQLAGVLFETLGLPPVKKTKTGYSTDSEVLEKLSEKQDWPDGISEDAKQVPSLILEYRQLTKLVGTYLKALQDAIADDGRVHCRFHQTGAATGRLSSSDPNLQNIPIRTDLGRDVRKAFTAAQGHKLVTADYSQIELRMLAHLAEDEHLIAAFHAGQDIHAAVAAQTYDVPLEDVSREQRNSAKMINFGIVYGITAFGLARRLGDVSNSEAQQIIDDYKARFPGINTFLDRCVDEAKTKGYVTTILGRRRAIPQIESRNPQQRALGERLAINSVVQGSAADLIKLAMVNLHHKVEQDNLPLAMLLQIHDELVCEAPDAKAQAMATVLTQTMENAMQLKVPLSAEAGIGDDWYDSK